MAIWQYFATVVMAVGLGLGTGRGLHRGSRPAPPPPIFTAVRMVTPEVGWAVSGSRIYRTRTAGREWTEVGPKLSAHDAIRPDFINAATAIVIAYRDGDAGATLYRTTDAGRSWTSAAVPRPAGGLVVSVDFLSASRGSVLYGTGINASGREEVQLYQTTTGGTRWSLVMRQGFATVDSGLLFRSATTGFLTGGTPTPGQIPLFVTHDGGKDWTAETLPVPRAWTKDILTSAPPLLLSQSLMILPVFIGGTGGDPVFYVSTDGGREFTPTTPVIPTDAFRDVTTAAWGFISPTLGWTIAVPGPSAAFSSPRLYVTDDGGARWHVADTRPALGGVTGFSLLSPTAGLALLASHSGTVAVRIRWPYPPSLGAIGHGGLRVTRD